MYLFFITLFVSALVIVLLSIGAVIAWRRLTSSPNRSPDSSRHLERTMLHNLLQSPDQRQMLRDMRKPLVKRV